MAEHRMTVDTALARFWDWVDERDIDKHAAFWMITAGSYNITQWAFKFSFANPTIEAASIVAAIVVPWSAVQAAAAKWYFDRGVP